MSLFDRAVLYIGVAVAVILAALSLYNVNQLKSTVDKVSQDSSKLAAQVRGLEQGKAQAPVQITVAAVAAKDCAAADGSCCKQRGPNGQDPNGNPYVHYGPHGAMGL